MAELRVGDGDFEVNDARLIGLYEHVWGKGNPVEGFSCVYFLNAI